jgi:uncharacterized protein (TIGR00299 family) protein
MSVIYIEPFSGASGDMFLGTLATLADAHDDLLDLPGRLHLHDTRIEIHEVKKNGIACRQVKVIDLGESPVQTGENPHDVGGGHHDSSRQLSDIIELIDAANIEDGAKLIAKEIFQLIGEAEAKVHAIPIEKIHFHEISGVDSIIDIVGTAVLVDRLKITKTYCDPICVGFGAVNTQHGLLPVPAPATAELLKGMPSFKGNEEGERLTPTGAAIIRWLKPEFNPPALTTKRVAYGPGRKDFAGPNVLRASLVTAEIPKTQFFVIETNIDDSSPEYLGGAFQSDLLKAGATDLFITSAQMKKGRPGVTLSVLVAGNSLESVSDFILENTTTIGVRYYPVERRILDRGKISIETEHGTVAAKQVITPSGHRRLKIEHDDLWAYSRKAGLSLAEAAAALQNRHRAE